MKTKTLGILLIIFTAIVAAFFAGRFSRTSESFSFVLSPTPTPTPLAKYSIDNLIATPIKPASFKLGETIKETKDFQSKLFTFNFDPTLIGDKSQKVSGVLDLPILDGTYPLIIMLRGYVDPKIYTPGTGSKNAGEFFAQNGFITVAPDFFGYAGSDTESGNIFESRFQTYTTVLTLLNSIGTPEFSNLVNNKWDGRNIFIWAHSNGGQIALTTLAISGEPIPTVLWAPVTKPFPYSVLYYTDESVDGGKFIRRELAKFESLYNIDSYTFTNYLKRITAPIEFEQGTADDAVPFVWTRSISNTLKKQGLDITYNEYPGSDHNLRPAWNTVVLNDIEFYKKHMK